MKRKSKQFVCSSCRNPTFTLETTKRGYDLVCSKCGFLEWANITGG
jgi:ribosomal protein S27AE